MADQKKNNKRYIGKIRNVNGNNGVIQTIYFDNLEPQNADGTPNQFYKGTLLWLDDETGQKFLVKQLGITVPQKGMDPKLTKNGFSCYITLDVESDYQVKKL